MIKLVISGGDSFTFGSELPDEHAGQGISSKLSWAHLVSEKLGAKHINTAWPGRSNSFIVRHVMHQVSKALRDKFKPEEIFVQVMWTYLGRQEILVNNLLHEYDRGGTPRQPGSGPIYERRRDSPWFHIDPHVASDESPEWEGWKAVWKENKRIGFVEYVKEYYKVTGELTDHYISLKEILFLQEFLENRNVKYMFTYVHTEIKDYLQICNVTSGYTSELETPMDIVDGMRKEIKFDEWFNFSCRLDNKKHEFPRISSVGFWNWASESKHTGPLKNKKYRLGPEDHPLEEAHQDAAVLIYDKISNIRR